MKFLYPQFLYALFALAIPIIIHLFNFKKYKDFYFSDISFLKSLKEKTKSQSQSVKFNESLKSPDYMFDSDNYIRIKELHINDLDICENESTDTEHKNPKLYINNFT